MHSPRAILLHAAFAALCLAAIPASAQGHGGGGMPGGGMPGGGGFPHNPNSGAMGAPRIGNSPAISSDRANPSSTTRGTLQLGPPGRWWDDKSYAKSLKLRPDQQTRMDSIFEQNRPALLTHYQGLQQAESQMDDILKSPTLDEPALFSGIDRIAQARAELEKANAHMLLQIRKEMDPDQLARLQKHQ